MIYFEGGEPMSEVDRQLQDLDDEIVQSAALVHRRRHAPVQSNRSPAVDLLTALLDSPEGRLESKETAGTAPPIRR
jgi:hypothetical protein